MTPYVDYRATLLGNILAHAEDMGLVKVPSYTDHEAFAKTAADAFEKMLTSSDYLVMQRRRYCFYPKWVKNVSKGDLLEWIPPERDIPCVISCYRETRQSIFVHGIIKHFIERIGGEEKLQAYGFLKNDSRVLNELYYEKPLIYQNQAMNGAFLLTHNIDPVDEHDRWCGLFWLIVSACDLRILTPAGNRMKANSLEEIYG